MWKQLVEHDLDFIVDVIRFVKHRFQHSVHLGHVVHERLQRHGRTEVARQ